MVLAAVRKKSRILSFDTRIQKTADVRTVGALAPASYVFLLLQLEDTQQHQCPTAAKHEQPAPIRYGSALLVRPVACIAIGPRRVGDVYSLGMDMGEGRFWHGGWEEGR